MLLHKQNDLVKQRKSLYMHQRLNVYSKKITTNSTIEELLERGVIIKKSIYVVSRFDSIILRGIISVNFSRNSVRSAL